MFPQNHALADLLDCFQYGMMFTPRTVIYYFAFIQCLKYMLDGKILGGNFIQSFNSKSYLAGT